MQHTTNYNLDMPEGNDQLSVMVNYNGNLQKIDTAIKTVEDKADAGSTDIEDLSATVSVLENNVTAVNTRLDSVEVDVTAVDDKADAIEVKADNALAGLQTKQNTITGGGSTITSSNLTTSRALVSDASGKVSVSNVTSTELGRLSGVTSNVQTQITSLRNHVDQVISSTNVTVISGQLIDFKLYKNGHIVFFDCNWVGARPSDGNILRLPINYRPIYGATVSAYNASTNDTYAATVGTDGVVNLGSVGTTDSIQVTLSVLFLSDTSTPY